MDSGSKSDLNMRTSMKRMLTAKTPILAIDSVKIHVNSSTLHNNIVSYRLRVVPFISDELLNSLEFAKKCKCKDHCSKCSVEVTLEVKCTYGQTRQVTMADLVSSDPTLFPVRASCTNKCNGDEYTGDILIMTLRTGQELKLTAHVKKSIGEMQAIFNPMGSYEFVLDAESALLYILYVKSREESEADTNKGTVFSNWPVTLGWPVIVGKPVTCTGEQRPVMCGEAYIGVKLCNPQKNFSSEGDSSMQKN